MSTYWYIILNRNPYFIQVPFLLPFYVPGSYPGHHMTCGHHVCSGFSGLVQFSTLPLFRCLWPCGGGLGRSFEAIPYWDLLGVSLMIRRVMGFVETDHRGQELPHHFMSREQALKTLITVDVNFGHLGEVLCQGSHCVLKPFLTAPVNPDHSLLWVS